MTEEELKLIEQMARKAALASFLGAENVGGNLMETLLVQKIANDFQTMSNFKKDNTLPTNTKQIIESITPQTPIQKENITPQINEESTPQETYNLKAIKTHSENPITGVVNKIKSTFEKPKHRELSEIPTEIHDPNQWHIDSAPLEIQHKPRNLSEVLSDEVKKYKDLGPIEALQKAASKFPLGSLETQYYGEATKLADKESPTNFMKKENYFYKLKDVKNKELKDVYTKKILEMQKDNPNITNDFQDMTVIIPKERSTMSNITHNSKEMKNWIAENYKKLENKSFNKSKSSINFKSDLLNENQRALSNVIHKADLNNPRINKDGSFSTELVDGFNFDKMNYQSPIQNNSTKGFWGRMMHNAITYVNNNAKKQQDVGQLENYVYSQPLWYSKEEIDKILEEDLKKKKHRLFK